MKVALYVFIALVNFWCLAMGGMLQVGAVVFVAICILVVATTKH